MCPCSQCQQYEARRTREVILFLHLVRLLLKYGIEFGIPHYKQRHWDTGVCSEKDWEHKSYEELLRELGSFSLKKKNKADLITLHTYLKGGCSETSVGLFSQATSDRTKEMASSCRERLKLDIRKNFLTEKVVKLTQGSTWVTDFKRSVDAVFRNMV